MSIKLVRYYDPQVGARWGGLQQENVYDLTAEISSLASWLQKSCGHVAQAIQELEERTSGKRPAYTLVELKQEPAPNQAHILAPLDQQEVWAAGVTYQRSQQARQEEASDGGDVYARVYTAERPELFYKGNARNVIGHRHPVGIRADAAWSVPEPELTILLNPALEVVGMTIGNDMSSRDLEGANPLYLPQAKIYTASCALGPAITLLPFSEWQVQAIKIEIRRNNAPVFSGETHTSCLHRSLAELVHYLGRSNTYPAGVFLMTGTGVVPPADFTLQAGDEVSIAIDEIGELSNPVAIV